MTVGVALCLGAVKIPYQCEECQARFMLSGDYDNDGDGYYLVLAEPEECPACFGVDIWPLEEEDGRLT